MLAEAWLSGQITSAAPSSFPWVGMSSFLCWQGEQSSLAWQLSGSAVTLAGWLLSISPLGIREQIHAERCAGPQLSSQSHLPLCFYALPSLAACVSAFKAAWPSPGALTSFLSQPCYSFSPSPRSGAGLAPPPCPIQAAGAACLGAGFVCPLLSLAQLVHLHSRGKIPCPCCCLTIHPKFSERYGFPSPTLFPFLCHSLVSV